MAALDARLDELRSDVYRRINDLKVRADDLHARAVALNHETNEKASAGTIAVNILQQAKNEVGALLEQETRIRRKDLPALEFELANLSSSPTYFSLRITAEGRVAADLAEKNKRIETSLNEARIAFDSHLAALATDETRQLARGLINACAAAKIDTTVHHLALGQLT